MRLIKGLQESKIYHLWHWGALVLGQASSASKGGSENFKDSTFSASPHSIYIPIILGSYSFKVIDSPKRLDKSMNSIYAAILKAIQLYFGFVFSQLCPTAIRNIRWLDSSLNLPLKFSGSLTVMWAENVKL